MPLYASARPSGSLFARYSKTGVVVRAEAVVDVESALLPNVADLLHAKGLTDIKRVDLTTTSVAVGPRHVLPIPEAANRGYGTTQVGPVSIYMVPNLAVSYRFIPKVFGEILKCGGILPGNYDVVHRSVEERRVAQKIRLRRHEIGGSAYVAFTTKYKEYGHFLLETLPKILLIRHLMDCGVRFPLVAPLDPPNWVNEFLLLIFKESELVRFSEFLDEALISTGLVPTLLGGGPFHPLMGLLIDLKIINRLTSPHTDVQVRRKLFISRAGFRGVNTKDFRILDNESEIQQLAINAGYEIIEPQALPVCEQVLAFYSATHVIGESSSALHNTMFGPKGGAQVLSLNMVNSMQTHIAALRCHSIDYALPADGQRRTWEQHGVVAPHFKVPLSDISTWIEKTELARS